MITRLRPERSMNRPVRTRMPGGVKADGENPWLSDWPKISCVDGLDHPLRFPVSHG
jgi:hypothetical protein